MSRSRTGRRLTAQEQKLWDRVARTAEPLDHRSPPPPAEAPKPKPPEPKKPATPAPAPRHVPISGAVQMDHKTFSRMRRGKLQPEGRIDLHGMTQTVAHAALSAFVLKAHRDGKRLVLVITGKGGRGADDTKGVLRRNVPHWLELPPLAQAVLQVNPSHQRHGGNGALYVYLRRPRG